MTQRSLLDRMVDSMKEIIHTYFRYKVSRSAAGLAYYLLLSMFPLALCISLAISHARFVNTEAIQILMSWLSDVLGVAEVDQLKNPNNIASVVVFFLSMTLMLTSSAGAYRCLTYTAEEITGERRFHGIFGTVFNYLFSFILFLMVYAAIAVMTIWNSLVSYISTLIPLPAVVHIIGNLHYLIVFAVFFLICFVLNFLMQPKDVNRRGIVPGSLFTALGMGIVTSYFSIFIRHSTKYSLVYGSLASIILLMMWLFMCGNILILGVIINATLHRRRKTVPISKPEPKINATPEKTVSGMKKRPVSSKDTDSSHTGHDAVLSDGKISGAQSADSKKDSIP